MPDTGILPSLLALPAAALFGAAMNTSKAGLRHIDGITGALISIPSATLVFWCLLAFLPSTGGWMSSALWVFATVGIAYPALTTLLTFVGNDRMGPTVTGTVGSTAPVFAAVSAVWVLGEHVSGAVLAGTAGIVAGIVLLSWQGRGGPGRWTRLALLYPIGAAVLRGLAQTFTKLGLLIQPIPYRAVLVSYTVSVVVVTIAFAIRTRARPPRFQRPGVRWFVLTGLLNGLAVLCLYAALNQGRVVIAAPLAATYPLFTLLFGVLVFRQEAITGRMVAGVALIVASVIVMTLLR